jgi:hypothetical protein
MLVGSEGVGEVWRNILRLAACTRMREFHSVLAAYLGSEGRGKFSEFKECVADV